MMSGANIKIKGHALKPPDLNNRYKWECSCGAWGTVISALTAAGRRHARRNEHDAHKIEVLRKQGKWEED